MTDVAEVPMPAPVAALPRDVRGVPIAAHVGRPPGSPIRLTDFDQRRLALITAQRRCTICAWKIKDDELCWYFSWPPSVEQNRRNGWRLWDPALEGAGHEECMTYSAIACPFLADRDYERRTVQRGAGEVITNKGVKRGDMILVGAPEAVIAINASTQRVSVVVGGGEPELRPFDHGVELRQHLDVSLSSPPRAPDDDDTRFAALMATTDDVAQLDQAEQQLFIELAAELRHLPKLERNALCPCGSGGKAKSCCLPRADAARLRQSTGMRRRAILL